MSFEGMDVGQVQAIARQLDANARALDGIAGLLAGVAEELILHWQGPAAARFQHEWAAQHRQALHAAAQALADACDRVVANIDQQQGASAADAGFGADVGFAALAGAALTEIGGGLRTAWNVAQDVDGKLSLVKTPLDNIEELAKGEYDPLSPAFDQYDKTWSRLMKLDHDGTFLKYDESPTLQWLHDSPGVRNAAEVLGKTHVSVVLDKLGPVGTAMGAISTGVDVGTAGAALAHHDYGSAGGDLVDATADGLKSAPYPPAYLAGATVALFKEDYDLGSQIDWKEGLPNPLTGDNFKNIYVPALESVPGEMVGPLEKAFF
jgi:uncharacterized protein YukE